MNKTRAISLVLVALLEFSVGLYFIFHMLTELSDTSYYRKSEVQQLKWNAGRPVEDLSTIIRLTAHRINELPPDSLPKLIAWLPNSKYYYDLDKFRSLQIDYENKKITGKYGEQIDIFKDKSGRYVMISYGKNNTFEYGKGDDYLLTFEIMLDKE